MTNRKNPSWQAFLPWLPFGFMLVVVMVTIGRGAHSRPQAPEAPARSADNHRAEQAIDGTQLLPAIRWDEVHVRSGDSLSRIFARLHLPASGWENILALGGRTRVLEHLHPGDILKVRLNESGALAALQYPLDSGHALLIKRLGEGWSKSTVQLTLDRRPVAVRATVKHSLYRSLRGAGLVSAQIAQLNNLFHWDINLSRQIQPGDTVTVVFNRLYRRNREIGNGPIQAAQIHTGGKTIRVVRYAGEHDDTGYYHPSGQAVHPALNRAPVHYKYISSSFSRHRWHPILHKYRPHWGVDYAAPRGTPIHAAGSGRITYRHRDGGYGNLIKIDNPGPYSTRYGHMSRFASGLHVGSHVHRGQVIGYVGATGLATGPHLHFEIRINGHPRNPRTVSLAGYKAIPKGQMKAFDRKVQPLLSRLQENSSVKLAQK